MYKHVDRHARACVSTRIYISTMAPFGLEQMKPNAFVKRLARRSLFAATAPHLPRLLFCQHFYGASTTSVLASFKKSDSMAEQPPATHMCATHTHTMLRKARVPTVIFPHAVRRSTTIQWWVVGGYVWNVCIYTNVLRNMKPHAHKVLMTYLVHK